MPPSNRRPLYTGEEVAEDSVVEFQVSALDTPDAVDAGPSTSMPNERVVMEQPCTFKGLASAAGAGILGYVLGTVPAAIRHKGRQWALTHKAGTQSASQLAIMSGLYTTIHCICFRLRQHEDGWNRGIAGCATGLALGFPNGPGAALQSCLGIGGISYILDFGTPPATAATALAEESSSSPSWTSASSSSSICRSCSSGQGCTTFFSPPDWLFNPSLSSPSSSNKGGFHPAAVAISAIAAAAADTSPVGGVLQAPLVWLAHACQEHLHSISATCHLPSSSSSSREETSSSSSSRGSSRASEPNSCCGGFSACDLQAADGGTGRGGCRGKQVVKQGHRRAPWDA